MCEPQEFEFSKDFAHDPYVNVKHSRAVGSGVLMTVSGDHMTVMATFMPAINNGYTMSLEEAITSVFSTVGISRVFMDEAAFRAAYNDMVEGHLVDSVVVGYGKQPEHGKDAQIQLFFDLPSDKPQREDGGKTNFKELRRFINVREGQLLARVSPATDGIPGSTVNGTPIPAVPGKPIEFFMGEGVRKNTLSTEFYASVDGHVVFKQNLITVYNTLEVKDVDFSTGNISFLGDVLVRGDIFTGFSVKGKNVVVNGICHDASISAENDIEIKTGIKGVNPANVISAGHDIIVGYCENATLVAKNNIIITKYSFNCMLDAGYKVESAEKSTVAGGQIRSFAGCDFYNVGTKTNTNINVVVGRKFDADEKFERIKDEKERLLESMDKVDSVLSVLNLNEAKVMANPKVKKLIETKNLLEKRISLFDRRMESLMRDSICANPTIMVFNEIQEGATLKFFGAPYHVRSVRRHVKFIFDPVNLVVDYQPLS
jgi:uncharacterized protein (DUF342 family)